MIGNFVFDIDGTLAVGPQLQYELEMIPREVRTVLGDKYHDEHCFYAVKIPYYIFPGFFELFQWLHSEGGKLLFFSSGTEVRNVELVDKVMKKVFGDEAKNMGYKIFSRHHCIDTSQLDDDEAEQYRTFQSGMRKKKLGGIVVPEEEVKNTVLIDDDYSYITKGEEYNFIFLDYCFRYVHPVSEDKTDKESFCVFHKAYYLAGLFSEMIDLVKTQNMSLVDAAKAIQVDKENTVLNEKFRQPGLERIEYYIKGKEILQKFNPNIKFYHDIPEEK